MIIDVYNMQLSNQPAEALAKYLVDTSGGAFALCGFTSGGSYLLKVFNTTIFTNVIQDRRLWNTFLSWPDRYSVYLAFINAVLLMSIPVFSRDWAITTDQIYCKAIVIPRKHFSYALVRISSYPTCSLCGHLG